MPTVRRVLRRRTASYLKIAAVSWLVFVASVIWRAIPAVIMVVSFSAVISAMLGILLAVRCPRCQTLLPHIGLAEVWKSARAVPVTNCPRCRGRLDDPF